VAEKLRVALMLNSTDSWIVQMTVIRKVPQ